MQGSRTDERVRNAKRGCRIFGSPFFFGQAIPGSALGYPVASALGCGADARVSNHLKARSYRIS